MTAMTFFRFASDTPYTGSGYWDGDKRYGREECFRCNGTGYLEYFAHNEKGRCFQCQGDGVLSFRLYNEKQAASQRRRYHNKLKVDATRALVNFEVQQLQEMKHSVQRGLRQIQRLRADAASDYVGAIGERIEFEATLVFVMGFDGFYGTTWINVMRDGDNNVIAYKGSACLGKQGDMLKIKGTVKEHALYKGAKQTVINRPKVVG
jgi:hypothetical protein